MDKIRIKYKIQLNIENWFILLIAINLITQFNNTNVYYSIFAHCIPVVIAVISTTNILQKSFKSLDKIQRLIVVMLIWLIVKAIFQYNSLNIPYFIEYGLLILMMLSFTCIKFRKKHMSYLLNAYILGGMLLSFLMIVGWNSFFSYQFRLTIKASNGTSIDPNYVAAFLVVPCLVSLFYTIENKTIIKKIYYGICFFVLCICTILTGSRGAIVAIILAICYTILQTKKISKKSMFGFIFILIIIAITFYFFKDYIPEDIISRLTGKGKWADASQESNVLRIFKWTQSIHLILRNPILGYGIGSTAEYVQKLLGISSTPSHCTYLELWIQFGIVYIFILYKFFVIVIKESKDKYFKALMIGNIIVSIFISANYSIAFWINIIICIMAVRTNISLSETCNGQYEIKNT